MKNFNDLEIGDRLYYIAENSSIYGIFEIKEIEKSTIIIRFFANNIIGNLLYITILPERYYFSIALGITNNNVFVTLYSDENMFLEAI